MKKTASKLIAAAGTSAVTALALTSVVLAKTYDYSSNSDGSAFGGLVVFCLYCLGFLVLIAFYVFVALQIAKIYEKNGVKDKKVMAFIPFANIYYLAISIGEEKNALMYTLSPLLSFIPCIGTIAYLIVMAMLWMKVAEKMGKDSVIGAAAVLVNFIPFVGLFISAYLIYTIAESRPVTTASAPTPKSEEPKK